ncbi:hypothetical protein PRIPAC_85813, partial [Pristionchus pacificus]|uniref:F-box domain-containing protein n=1 Tax=Pristionchus pacificus TaxID=54126 RepID=A0A2A6BMC8_PRIPA
MASSSIADHYHYNHLTSRIMWPFSECFREPENINSILPNELLVRIFNLVDEVPRRAHKPRTKTSLAVPMRLTCRRWNKLLSDASNRLKLARIRRIPIGVMKISQLDKSYGIFMIDSTDEELISRIMKGKDYYWGSEENKDKAIPTIRSKNL